MLARLERLFGDDGRFYDVYCGKYGIKTEVLGKNQVCYLFGYSYDRICGKVGIRNLRFVLSQVF